MNLAAAVEAHPADALALVTDEGATTYGVLREQVAALRGGLARLGLEPGDRLAVIAPNSLAFATSYLAGLGAGLVVVPLNPASTASELEREIASVDVRAAVVGGAGLAAFAAVDRAQVPTLEHVVVTAGDHGTPLDEMLAAAPSPLVARDDDDLAVLMFTSGTAGFPKAAMLTHGNLLANIAQAQAAEGRAQGPDDLVLGVLPMFHIFGLNVVLGLSLVAGSAVLLVERFDPAACLKAVATHGVTVVPGAPALWASWAALPDADPEALSTVRLAASGAARLPVDVMHAIERRFGIAIAEGYGLTEASPIVTTSMGTGAAPGSIGVPLPGLQVRLVDGDGDDVLVGDAGEIWVKGPNVFQGYWDDAEATATALGDDGWLRTGDIAVVDDTGALFLVDRAKDLIIVSGFNVFPAEVEEVLLEVPGVTGAAVVGVPDPRTGEAVKAVVSVEAGRTIGADEIVAACALSLSRYKCPSTVEFVDELPTNLGKVLRRTFRSTS